MIPSISRCFRGLAISAASIALSSCAHKSTPPGEVTQVNSRATSQIIYLADKSCPSRSGGQQTSFAVAAAALVIPELSKAAVNAIIDYMKAQQAKLSITYATQYPAQFLKPDGSARGCLILARGEFGPKTSASGGPRGKLTVETLQKTKLVDWPSLYIEYDVTGKDSVLLLRPVLLHYAATAAPLTSSDSKSLVVLLTFTTAPTSNEKGKLAPATNAAATMFAEKIKIGTEIADNPNDPSTLRDWNVAIPLTNAANGKAINVAAVVTENEDPSLGSKMLLSTLETNKDKLAEALSNLLLKPIAAEESVKSAQGSN